MQTTEYVAARNTDEFERERLSLLEQVSDPQTFVRMTQLGVADGWRCLEVGAGGGSVVRWLAEQTAPTGSVVATDIDPRFLDGIDLPNVDVRRHDIVNDEIEENAFDLVHCRALLLHLPERRRALERMYSAVRPGGWLFVEDLDVTTMYAADPSHPDAAEFDRLEEATLGFFASIGIFDPSNGRRLRAMVDNLELSDVGQSGSISIVRGSEPAARFYALGAEMTRPLLVGHRVVSDSELDAQLRRFADPTFTFTDAVTYQCWGLKRH